MAGESHLLRMLEPAVRPTGSPAPAVQPRGPVDGMSFDQMLRQAQSSQPIQISDHAQQRLDEMGVQMTESRMAALGEAVNRAAEQGARDALVMLDDTAMVVSATNRTLVTAMDESRMREAVITNIDAAVWANQTSPGPPHRLQL